MKVTLTKRLKALMPDYITFRNNTNKFQMSVMTDVNEGIMPFGEGKMTPEDFLKIAESALKSCPKLGSIDAAKRLSMVTALEMLYSRDFGFPEDLTRQLAADMRIFTAKELSSNPYMANIKIPEISIGQFRTTTIDYGPYELFMYDIPTFLMYGFCSPRIGFFEEFFSAPALMEQNSAWMSITPNEICTMEKHIQAANGRVLTLGCGLGYYAYMVSIKETVSEVTIIEKDPNVIELFTQHILPQFSQKEKIRVIQADAIDYLKTLSDGMYDYCFADIWQNNQDHDTYLRVKTVGNKFRRMKMSYWIEESLVQGLSSFVPILFNLDLNRILKLQGPSPEVFFDNYKKDSHAFMKALLKKEVVETPEDLERILFPHYLLKLLSKKSLKYPVDEK